MTVRNCCGTFCILTLNFSILLIPMSFCFVISSMQAFIISLLAYLLLKEPILKSEIMAMSSCLFIVGFMSIFIKKERPKVSLFDKDRFSEVFIFYLGIFLTFCAIVLTSFFGILGKKLKANLYVICAWYSINGIVILGLYIMIRDVCFAEKSVFLSHNSSGWMWALIGSIANSFAQLAWTKAFSVGKSTTIGLFVNLAVIYTFITDILVFKLSFGAIEVICSMLILGITVAVPLYNTQMKNLTS